MPSCKSDKFFLMWVKLEIITINEHILDVGKYGEPETELAEQGAVWTACMPPSPAVGAWLWRKADQELPYLA